MNAKEQIDYMINSLQLAKAEIEYAEKYMSNKEKDKDFYYWGHAGHGARTPNGTIIRESLKMVGRLANITAKNITLCCYNDEIFSK
jgi:hypothetical protein